MSGAGPKAGSGMLGTMPSPRAFADAWKAGFEAAVRFAAGRDGRLSMSEARRIATTAGPMAKFGDNAVNYLLAKGQDSVSVERIIEEGYRFVLAAATRANSTAPVAKAPPARKASRPSGTKARPRPKAKAPVKAPVKAKVKAKPKPKPKVKAKATAGGGGKRKKGR